MEDVKFTINKDDASQISGFTLTGVGNTHSECFCLSFLIAQGLGKANVDFEDGKIVFNHNGVTMEDSDDTFGIYTYHCGGVHSEDIEHEDEIAIKSLLNGSGEYARKSLSVRPVLSWGKGFTLTAQ
jgi:hypothetical protein